MIQVTGNREQVTGKRRQDAPNAALLGILHLNRSRTAESEGVQGNCSLFTVTCCLSPVTSLHPGYVGRDPELARLKAGAQRKIVGQQLEVEAVDQSAQSQR